MRNIKCLENVKDNKTGKVLFTKGKKYQGRWTNRSSVYVSADDFGSDHVIYNGGDVPLSWYSAHFDSYTESADEETNIENVEAAYDRAMSVV